MFNVAFYLIFINIGSTFKDLLSVFPIMSQTLFWIRFVLDTIYVGYDLSLVRLILIQSLAEGCLEDHVFCAAF